MRRAGGVGQASLVRQGLLILRRTLSLVGVVLLAFAVDVAANVAADRAIVHPHAGPSTLPSGYADVSYRPGVHGAFLPPVGSKPVVVLVPGDGGTRGDATVAAIGTRLHQIGGYGALIIDKTYIAKRLGDSGGDREADDVRHAVDWAHGAAPVSRVVAFGFSAGGYETLLAVARGAPVAAVVTDGGFNNAATTYVPGPAPANHWARPFYRLMPVLFPLVSHGGHLRHVRRWPGVPAFIIQGGRDTEVEPATGAAVQRLTGGELWSVTGAGHLGAYDLDPDAYIARVSAFLALHG